MMTTAPVARDIWTPPALAAPTTPMGGLARLHHTRWAERSFSFTHTTPLQLQRPSDAMFRRVVEAADDQLDIDVSGCRILELSFAQAADDALTPVTALWCLDADSTLAAAFVSVSITGQGTELCAIRPEQFQDGTVTGTMSVHVDGRLLPGRVHLTLTPERVAIGVQIPLDGAPILTASVSGEFAIPERHSGDFPQTVMTKDSARNERFSGLRLVR